jgi:sulfonate transport system substrate-binding protein
LCVAIGSARAAEPLDIRHGWVALTGTVSPLVFEKPDILRKYGKTYTVDPIHFAGTSPELIALATDQIDIATLAYSSFANGIENAHLDDMRIIADGFQDGANGYASIEYMVRNDGGIKRIEDLKGKVFGVNVIGAAVDIGGRAVLKKHGLDAGRDYSIIEAPFPAIAARLLQGNADVVSLVQPFNRAPEVAKGAHTLFTSYFLTKDDTYRDPDAIPDLAAFQRNIDTQLEFGFLDHSFDVGHYADLSFVERAAKRYGAETATAAQ